jgi:hypothetical protein
LGKKADEPEKEIEENECSIGDKTLRENALIGE